MGNNRADGAMVREIARRIYPRHNFENHILPAVRIALDLAGALGANAGIVEPAVYLHDLGRVVFLYRYHAQVGASLARIILAVSGYANIQARAICYCVRVHESKPEAGFQTTEAEIVANADALSQIENFLYMFAIHWATHGRHTERTRRWLKEKLERNLENKVTLEIARARYSADYACLKFLLDEPQTI
jgi:HD superfamily phosphodiesterase